METILQTLVTKSDLIEAERSIIRWIVGDTGCASMVGITVMVFILSATPKTIAAVQLPIVVIVLASE